MIIFAYLWKKSFRKNKVEFSKSADLQGFNKNGVESRDGRKGCAHVRTINCIWPLRPHGL